MKTWKKEKSYSPEKTFFVWRHRNVSRFNTKIFTWVLGGFVAGIMTSIILPIIISPELTEVLARIAFFVVTIAGIISAFYRNVVNGLEYRLTNLGIVHVKPVVGIQTLADKLKNISGIFADRFETISWQDVKEIRDENNELAVLMKDKDPVSIGVDPYAMYKDYQDDKVAATNPKLFSKADKDHTGALKLVVKKARDVKKYSVG